MFTNICILFGRMHVLRHTVLVSSLIYFIVNYFLVVLVVEPIFATKGTYIQLQKRPQLHPGALRPESLTGSAVLRAYENKPWRGSNTKSAIGPVFKRRYCCGDTFLRDTWHRIVSLDAVLLSICVTELFFSAHHSHLTWYHRRQSASASVEAQLAFGGFLRGSIGGVVCQYC